MKQLAFMILLTGIGTIGAFQYPFLGLFVYYLFAVLRPQFLWEWSLPPGYSWSQYVALATIASSLLGGTRRGPDGGQANREWRASTLWILAFALWICVTYVTARDREFAYRYFEDYLKIFVMMFVAMALIRAAIEVWSLMVMAALTLAYIAYEVNALYFDTGYILVYWRGYAGLDNNGAGLMIAMGIPLCLAAWDTIRSPWRWLFLAMIPLSIHAVLMSYSRGAMLSLIVGGPMMLLRCRRKVQAAFFTAAVVLWAIPVMAGPEIRDRFLTLNDVENDGSANSRKQSWAAAWNMALDHPIVGVGVRNANLFSHEYGADVEGRTIHSQYLQIAADNGLVGLGLYLGMLSSVWLDTRRTRRWCRGRDDPEARRLYGVATGVECAMLVFCFGAIFLSLETFELPFLLLVLGARTGALARDWASSALADATAEGMAPAEEAR